MPKDVLVPKRRFMRLLEYIERLGLDVPEMLKPLGMDLQRLLMKADEKTFTDLTTVFVC